MGKKKKQVHGVVQQEKHSKNAGKMNGFTKDSKIPASKAAPKPVIQKDLKTNGETKKKNKFTANGSDDNSQMSPDCNGSGSRKRKANELSKAVKKPKYEPGKFVRPPPKSPTPVKSSNASGSGKKKKNKAKKLENVKENNDEKSLCRFDSKNIQDVSCDDIAGYPSWLFRFEGHDSSSDTDYTSDSCENDSSTDGESLTFTDDLSDENDMDDSMTYSCDEFSSIDEEFSTDTDFTDGSMDSESESTEASFNSEDDDDYHPGEAYDDVIIRPGEAKYAKTVTQNKKLFEDDDASQIIDYYSDTNDEVTVKKKSKVTAVPSDLDTSKSVVTAPAVRLDKPPKSPNTVKSPYTKPRKNMTCSKDCAHNHTDQKILPKGSDQGRPVSFLKNDEKPTENVSDVGDTLDVSIPETSTEELVSVDTPDTADIAEGVEDGEEQESIKIKFYNGIDSYHVLIHLTESINFHGNLSIKLVAGRASVLGYCLNVGEKVTANAPTGHSSVDITPIASESTDDMTESLNELKDLFFESNLQEIRDNLQSSHAIILLHRTSNKRVKMVEKYSSSRVFPNMISYKRPRLFAVTEYILQCRFSLRTRFNFQPNPDWKWINMKDKSRIVTTGGKNVGKSSLLRYLINQNLKTHGKILLVDLDIGQPEFFVPQTVSATLIDCPILGMGCFTEKEPDLSYLFGDLNVANSPQRYLECVARLIDSLHQDDKHRDIPWIVNTMGYVKGVGLELMIALLKLISPTDVIQITHDIPLENFEQEITAELVNNWTWTILESDANPCGDFKTFLYHTMVSDNVAVDIRKAKGAVTREVNILAHLGSILGENCDWITQAQPVFAPLDKLKILNFTDENINEEENLDLLNANLVYLCKRSDDNDIIQCLGIGIVRGIDEAQRTVYLLPSTRDKLTKVDSLAICNITLPPQLILNQSSQVKGELAYVYNTDEAIGSRNVLPRPFRGEKAMSNLYTKNQSE
ncbi:hypothetical protein DMENIID0001_078560 [Sergentomyia squamirostris]